MSDSFSPASENPDRLRWHQYLPVWEQPAVVVLETSTELSSALGAELYGRRQLLSPPLPPVSATRHAPNRQGLICVSATTSAQVLSRLRERTVVAIVLDLVSHGRESLVLLRQLQTTGSTAAIAAIGDERHHELTSLLFEAGCSLLATQLPSDVQIANWVERVVAHHQ